MRKANESRESRDVSEFGIKSNTCIFKYTYQCVYKQNTKIIYLYNKQYLFQTCIRKPICFGEFTFITLFIQYICGLVERL